MSYGPLKNCYKCKTPLNLNDPNNEGYCGGHYCLAFGKPDWMKREEKKGLQKPTGGLNRKQRRAAARKARKQA